MKIKPDKELWGCWYWCNSGTVTRLDTWTLWGFCESDFARRNYFFMHWYTPTKQNKWCICVLYPYLNTFFFFKSLNKQHPKYKQVEEVLPWYPGDFILQLYTWLYLFKPFWDPNITATNCIGFAMQTEQKVWRNLKFFLYFLCLCKQGCVYGFHWWIYSLLVNTDFLLIRDLVYEIVANC